MAFLVSASNRENIKLHKLTNLIEQNCTYNNEQAGNFSQSMYFQLFLGNKQDSQIGFEMHGFSCPFLKL